MYMYYLGSSYKFSVSVCNSQWYSPRRTPLWTPKHQKGRITNDKQTCMNFSGTRAHWFIKRISADGISQHAGKSTCTFYRIGIGKSTDGISQAMPVKVPVHFTGTVFQAMSVKVRDVQVRLYVRRLDVSRVRESENQDLASTPQIRALHGCNSSQAVWDICRIIPLPNW